MIVVTRVINYSNQATVILTWSVSSHTVLYCVYYTPLETFWDYC